jgi:hypothetical protein
VRGYREAVLRRVLVGAAAGAAGTTALNAVSYADMALRGRAASQAPDRVVERSAELLGTRVPGSGDRRANRLSALGALGGNAVGVAVGVAYALLRGLGWRPALPAATVVTGLAAMAAADVPLAALGVSDPRTWSAVDWASDVVPHLAYGLVTAAVTSLADDG